MIGTLQELKDYIGEEKDAQDERLTTMLVRASSLLAAAYGRRNFEVPASSYDELWDGGGGPVLQLGPDVPLTEVTSVLENGVALVVGTDPSAVPTPDVVWYEERGQLRRLGSVFAELPRYYRVVYKAGYTAATMPEIVKQAAFDFAALLAAEKQRIGIQSKTAGQQTTTFLRSLPDHVKIGMERFRVRRLAA